ncbi:MAG TPA: hypothetical protein EYP90_15410 [Chromatiaceae bacterium]|nr:hypothetical protein [Chromatiaceae bacterium]
MKHPPLPNEQAKAAARGTRPLSPVEKLSRILGKAVIWAFSGTLYGGFFTGLLGYLLIEHDIGHWYVYILASLISGAVIAAFFGSMLVALGGTLTGILTAISYQIIFSTYHQPLILLGIALAIGLFAGSFFTRREIHDAQPLAQAMAGFVSGLLAGPLLYLAVSFWDLGSLHWAVAAISVSLVGLFYVPIIKNMPTFLKQGLAEKLGGPLVSGIIAMAVASVFWLIGESYMTIPLTNQESSYQMILDSVPLGLLGGAIGGAFGGAMLEILGIRLEEHIL